MAGKRKITESDIVAGVAEGAIRIPSDGVQPKKHKTDGQVEFKNESQATLQGDMDRASENSVGDFMLESTPDWSSTGSWAVLPRVPDDVEEAKREALQWALNNKVSCQWFPSIYEPALTEVEAQAVIAAVEHIYSKPVLLRQLKNKVRDAERWPDGSKGDPTDVTVESSKGDHTEEASHPADEVSLALESAVDLSPTDDGATAAARMDDSWTPLGDFETSSWPGPAYVNKRGRFPDYLRGFGVRVMAPLQVDRSSAPQEDRTGQEVAKSAGNSAVLGGAGEQTGSRSREVIEQPGISKEKQEQQVQAAGKKTIDAKPAARSREDYTSQEVTNSAESSAVLSGAGEQTGSRSREVIEQPGISKKKQERQVQTAEKKANDAKPAARPRDRLVRLENRVDVKALIKLVRDELAVVSSSSSDADKGIKRLEWELILLKRQYQSLTDLPGEDAEPGLPDLLRWEVSNPFPLSTPVQDLPLRLSHTTRRLRDEDRALICNAFDLQTYQGVGKCIPWLQGQLDQLKTSPMHWQPKTKRGPKESGFLLEVVRLWQEMCSEQYNHTPPIPPGVMLKIKDVETGEPDPEESNGSVPASPSYSPYTPTPTEWAEDDSDSRSDVDSAYPAFDPELPENWEELVAETEKLNRKAAMCESAGEQRGASRNEETTKMRNPASGERKATAFESIKPEGRVPGSVGVPASVSGPDGVSVKPSLAVEGDGADEDSDLEEGEIKE